MMMIIMMMMMMILVIVIKTVIMRAYLIKKSIKNLLALQKYIN